MWRRWLRRIENDQLRDLPVNHHFFETFPALSLALAVVAMIVLTLNCGGHGPVPGLGATAGSSGWECLV